AIQVDMVGLVCAPGDPRPKLRVDGLGADGRWRTLADGPEIMQRLPPMWLRRAAVEELKVMGFDYIVAHRDSGPGLEMRLDASFWGVTCVTEVGGACLFHLD